MLILDHLLSQKINLEDVSARQLVLPEEQAVTDDLIIKFSEILTFLHQLLTFLTLMKDEKLHRFKQLLHFRVQDCVCVVALSSILLDLLHTFVIPVGNVGGMLNDLKKTSIQHDLLDTVLQATVPAFKRVSTGNLHQYR